MFTRRIEILIVGLAFAGKNCGATEVAVSPGDSQLAITPQTRIKKSDAVKMPPQKKEKPAMKKGNEKALPKKGKPGMPKGKNQNSPSLGKTVDEIICAVTEKNGIIYATDEEEIFNGSGVVRLQKGLGAYSKMIKPKLNGETSREHLEEILELVKAQINIFNQLIYYAYFEMPNSSPESIENHNQYYGVAKDWFEKIKDLVESKIEEKELENEGK